MLAIRFLFALVMSVGSPPVESTRSSKQDAIDHAVGLMREGKYLDAVAAFRQLLNPADSDVSLDPKQWHTLLLFAVKAHGSVADAAPTLTERRKVLLDADAICKRYINTVGAQSQTPESLNGTSVCKPIADKLLLSDPPPSPPERKVEKDADEKQAIITDPASNSRFTRRTVGIGIAAVGGLSLLAAGGMGLATWSTGKQYAGLQCETTPDPDCQGLFDRGKSFVGAQWGLLAAGGVLVLVGVPLAVVPQRAATPPRTTHWIPMIGPRHAGVILRWSF